MLRALTSASTGMIAQQLNIDTISNNIANVNTAGYKKVRAEFQALLGQVQRKPGALVTQGTNQPVGIEIGLGVKTSATQRNFTPGSYMPTGGDLDIAIEGDGFFQVQLDDGMIAYTRDGSFKRDANGALTTTDGYMIQPQVTIPQDAKDITITPNGTISVSTGNQPTQIEVGTLELVKFLNPAGLSSIGKNLFIETPGSGQPVQGIAGQEGFGTTLQGYLEGSNVQIVEELVALIQAERAFESNSKVVQAGNDMLKQANQLR